MHHGQSWSAFSSDLFGLRRHLCLRSRHFGRKAPQLGYNRCAGSYIYLRNYLRYKPYEDTYGQSLLITSIPW